MIRQTITAHISPYLGGLAPETHDYVRHLNDEARRLKSGVSWIALDNRILAHGNINRALKFTQTLGAWALRRAISAGYLAHKPQPFWETAAIEGEELVLRRGNSSHRKWLRRLEKNQGRSVNEFRYARPGKLHGLARPMDSLPTPVGVSIAAETLYHLIDMIPQLERDREQIYPADFRAPQIPLWRPDVARRPGLGLRDYSEPLPQRPGYRQKAASPGWSVHLTPELATHYSQLPMRPTAEQRMLERIRCLYRSEPGKSRSWPSKWQRTLFDKCRAASVRPRGAPVIVWPRRNYQQLLADQPAHNAQHDSYWNSAGSGRLHRRLHSINIPREVVEVQNKMIANLERDFTRDEAEVA